VRRSTAPSEVDEVEQVALEAGIGVLDRPGCEQRADPPPQRQAGLPGDPAGRDRHDAQPQPEPDTRGEEIGAEAVVDQDEQHQVADHQADGQDHRGQHVGRADTVAGFLQLQFDVLVEPDEVPAARSACCGHSPRSPCLLPVPSESLLELLLSIIDAGPRAYVPLSRGFPRQGCERSGATGTGAGTGPLRRGLR